MTRTDAFKVLYFARAGGILLSGTAGGIAMQRGYAALAAALGLVFLILLLSGRVQAWFWSDLLAGLHHLNRRDYPQSKACSERFLDELRKRPWMRHLIWLATSSYSADAEVLALNNLGAAEIGLGDTDTARAHLLRAIDLDPKCPLPYLNMGVLVRRTENADAAAPWLREAALLGFRGARSDERALASQRNNAAVSTTGGPWG